MGLAAEVVAVDVVRGATATRYIGTHDWLERPMIRRLSSATASIWPGQTAPSLIQRVSSSISSAGILSSSGGIAMSSST